MAVHQAWAVALRRQACRKTGQLDTPVLALLLLPPPQTTTTSPRQVPTQLWDTSNIAHPIQREGGNGTQEWFDERDIGRVICAHYLCVAPKPGPTAGILLNKVLAYLLPPAPRILLQASWDGGCRSNKSPRSQGSMPANLYPRSKWFLGSQSKEVKIQPADGSLNANSTPSMCLCVR